jgi:hypothetical protein
MSGRGTRAPVAVTVAFPLRTSNPNNGATGNTRLAGILRAKARKAQRQTTRLHVLSAGPLPPLPVRVTITRIAPSKGLDPHDGLGAALKAVIDGTADALGLDDDRDPRVSWVLEQRRGPRGAYGVEVRIEPVEQAPSAPRTSPTPGTAPARARSSASGRGRA